MKDYFLNLIFNYNKRNNSQKNYYLGVWCYSPEDIENKYKFTVKNPLEKEHIQNKAFNYHRKLSKKLSKEIYNCLNKIHNKSYSYEYWNNILGLYIEKVVSIVYQKWILFQKLLRENPNKKFNTQIFKIDFKDIVFNTTKEFQDNFLCTQKGEMWQNLIDYLIIKRLNCFKLKFIKKPKIKNENNKKNFFKLKILFFISNICLKFFNKVDNLFLTPINPKLVIKEFLKIKKIPIYLNTEIKEEFNYNKKFRNWKINYKTNNEFENFLCEIFPYIIPKSILEGFDKNINIIKKNYNFSVKNIFFSVGQSDFNKILISEKKLSGTKLVNIQHGGNYGFIKRYVDENYELELADYFLSFGFGKENIEKNISRHKNKIVKIGPLNFPKENKVTKLNKILFILPHFKTRFLQMNSYPWTLQKYEHLNQIIEFFNKLNKNVKDKAVIRFHFCDKKYIKKYFKKKIKGINFEKSENLAKLNTDNFDLVVSMYPGTSFLETTFKNIPSIICFSQKHFKLKKAALKKMKLLKKNNIYFDNINTILKFLEKNHTNIEMWWSNKKVCKAKEYFIKDFANNKNLSLKFSKFIKSIN